MQQLIMPKHLLASEGRIYPKSVTCTRSYTPKVIEYKHTIRVITPFQCSHEQELKQLSYLETQLNEKQKEIEDLRRELKYKDQQLLMKEEEIQRLKENSNRQLTKTIMTNSIMVSKIQKSQVTDIFQSNIQSTFNDICLNNLANTKASFLFQLPLNQCSQSNASILKIQEQFSNIQSTLSQLENALNRPKKKYQYFNRKIDSQISKFPPFMQKLSINPKISEKNQIQTSHLIQNQVQNADEDQGESNDHESTNESFDTTDFLQQAISQHNMLKEALIQLQKSTKAKMEAMKKFYESEIEDYKRMLESQKAKREKGISYELCKDFPSQYNQLKCQIQSILNGLNTKTIEKDRFQDND